MYIQILYSVARGRAAGEGRVAKKDDGKGGKKDSQLILRLDKDDRDAFIKLCKKMDTSAAREVRRFIREFLEKNG